MPEIGNSDATAGQRLTVRIGLGSLSFSLASPVENTVRYEPYGVKGGMSMAANMREALKALPFGLEHRRKVLVLADTPVVFIPADEFAEGNAEMFYMNTLTGMEGCAVMQTAIPGLNTVAVYSMNKDLKQVIEDNFDDVKFSHTCVAVLRALHKRSLAGGGRKLFCHFAGRRLDVYSFRQNRFRFANSYDTPSPRDAVYFILHVWQQLGFDPLKDELHITGGTPGTDTQAKELRRYIRNVCMLSPKAEFNRSAAADIEGMPYDLMALFHRF